MIQRRCWSAGKLGLVIAILCCGQMFAQVSAATAPRSLDQLIQRASLIVRGHVVSAHIEPHPQFQHLTTVLVTMEVDETLKGAPRKNLEFRQFIWDVRAHFGSTGYTKGQELLLMLNPVSRYGLTSPVGVDQGRFRILRDSSGKAQAVNDRGNRGLFVSTEQAAHAKGVHLSQASRAMLRRSVAGPVPLQNLEETIRGFARTNR